MGVKSRLLLGNEHSLVSLWQAQNDKLEQRIRHWHRVFQEFKPDLIVADYAPSLALAARGRVPVLAIGSGYTLPPTSGQPFPAHRPQGMHDIVADEDFLLAWINEVLRRSDCVLLDRLAELNAANASALLTIPMFDPHWKIRDTADYCGVIHPGGAPRPQPISGKPPIVYFNHEADISALAEVLIRYGDVVDAYFGPQNAEMKKLLRNSKVNIHERTFELSRELPGRKFTLHAGSLGMCAAALFAAEPSFSLFLHDEGYCNARATAISMTGHGEPLRSVDAAKFATKLHDETLLDRMRGYATTLSDRYATYRDNDPALKVAEIARALL